MWLELAVDVARRRFERLSFALFEAGASGVQEDHRPGEAPPPRQPWDDGPPPRPSERVLLRAWFEDPDRDAVTAVVTREAGLDAGPVQWSPVDDVDWDEAWKANFPVIAVTPRLVIAPPWDPRPGAIVIEPGQGFGTGQHPTTRAALVAIDALAVPGGSCLDVGCGSGILAIAAARLGMKAVGIDVEEAAIADARRNAAANGVDVEFSTAPLSAMAPADLVVANLHVELIEALAAELRRVTARDLVLAGILADREARVTECFPGWPAERTIDGEWVSLRIRRP